MWKPKNLAATAIWGGCRSMLVDDLQRQVFCREQALTAFPYRFSGIEPGRDHVRSSKLAEGKLTALTKS